MPPSQGDIPGFYYDAEKNRYFPLDKNHPKEAKFSQSSSRASKDIRPSSRSRRPNLHLDDAPALPKRSTAQYLCSFRSHHWRRAAHDSLKLQYASTCYSKIIWSYPNYPSCGLRSFSVSCTDDTKQVAGDTNGFVYIYSDVGTVEDATGRHTHRLWSGQCGLMSPISSCGIIKDKFFASSFGPHPKVLVGSFSSAQHSENTEGIIIERRQNVWDVWCGTYAETSFVLGMTNHLWIVSDLDNLQSARTLRIGSDALTLGRDETCVYAGLRNGSVHVLDMGRDDQYGKRLLQAPTSVTGLSRLREWELLTALIDGSLDIYDLRMLRRPGSAKYVNSSTKDSRRIPLLSLCGHVSTVTISPPIATTPSQDFIFAAGEDNIIRGWSTLTGERLEAPEPCALAQSRHAQRDRPLPLLSQAFNARGSRYVSLRITDHEAGRRVEPKLWAATDAGITRFDLGRNWNDYA